ncbi:LysM peptidoglycan-binding domain-containing protein [Kitasatospora sp. NBC_01287]|uniref:BTAD domain-containing putative transcriptional regulator n=1 Tax=Kitasatospora sp. NBC_01287 TaxID=2903573 RepID=UPI002253BE28|nr:BTAD domain-containing putative transcriptional regulator [Kitasatospora sp. NBC_01287]MCX4750578.1 LysM peptidoglycan-binding domain-containing protein [Kitasatospora sp. NBC_01287]
MTPFAHRAGHLLRALVATAALTGLLAGLPYALLHYAAQFRPQHLPTLGEATVWAQDPLAAFLLLQLLYCASWLLWAYLLLQVLREVCWYAANFGALLSEAGPGAVTAVARRTIAGLLVGAIVLAIAAGLRGTPVERGDASLAAWTTPIAATAPATPVPSPNSATARAAASTDTTAACEVRPGDTLWDLAERHLDNPLRWKEIYQLNRLRPQPDGSHLSDPDRITPGWTMLLPPAANPAPVTSRPAPVPAPPTRPTPSPRMPSPTAATPSTPVEPHATTAQDPAAAAPPAVPHQAAAPGIQLPREAGYLALAVGTALSAAAVRRTLHRRRDYHPGDVGEEHHPRPEETSLVAALRSIASLHPPAGREPGADQGDVPLATRGTRQCHLLDLLAGNQQAVLALSGPGAEDAARALLVTVLTAPGQARLLLPRTDAVRLAPGLANRRLPACQLTADLDEALSVLETELLRRTRQHHDAERSAAAREPRPMVLLTQHDPRHHQRLAAVLKAGRPHGLTALVLTGTAPAPPDALAYQVDTDGHATAGSPHTDSPLHFFHLPMSSSDILLGLIQQSEEQPLAETRVIAGGASAAGQEDEGREPSPGAPERKPPTPERPENSVGTQNSIELGKASQQDRSDNSELMLATGRDVPSGTAWESIDPQRTPRSRPTAEAGAGETRTAVAERRPVSVTLLGPLAATVRGDLVAKGLSGYAGELLAHLATHPGGSTKDAILEAIWPDKDPATTGTEAFHTAKKSIRGALRTALGATTSLGVLLQAGGLWRLDPMLAETDLDAFHEAVRRATTTPDQAERLAAHRRTVALYTGELCEGMDRPWLTAPREEARRRVLNALGILATGTADPEEALGLLERALEHDPYNEELHLRLARQHIALGRTEAVHRTQERLRSRLAEIEERPTAATTRAFHELLAGRSARSVLDGPTPRRPESAASLRPARSTSGPGAPVRR